MYVAAPYLRASPTGEVQHILIVDDDPDIRNVVADILAMSHYTVRMANNGLEALNEVRKQRPAMVLLDLMMPIMDGWEFLRRLKREPPQVQVPVAVMSAARDAGAVSDELGAQAFLPKPFELDDVLTVVDRLAGGRPSPA
jgi:two-component system, chemotaxis family, chemotaxis protein CheY